MKNIEEYKKLIKEKLQAIIVDKFLKVEKETRIPGGEIHKC